MVATGHNNTAIAAPGLPDRRHRDIRSTRRVRTAGRDGAGQRRCWRRTRGGVVCGGPPDQSRKQALAGRAGLARRSKGVGIDAGPFGLVRLGGILRRRWEGIRFEDESVLTRPVGHPQMTLRPDCGRGGRTKARYALVCGDFRRVHRDGADRLLVPSRRVAAQGDRALQQSSCFNTSTRRVSASGSADRPRRRRAPDRLQSGDEIDAMMDCGHLRSAV
jgi:hypothetical protein